MDPRLCIFWCLTTNRWVTIKVECNKVPDVLSDGMKLKDWWKIEVHRLRELHRFDATTVIVRERMSYDG